MLKVKIPMVQIFSFYKLYCRDTQIIKRQQKNEGINGLSKSSS